MANAEANLDARAALFKALGHPVRLLILNLIHLQPRHGEELAVILNLDPATISHHLSKLADAGLLTATKDQYYQTYALVPAVLEQTLGQVVLLPQPKMEPKMELDAYRQKVIQTFFKRGRLVEFPAQLKKQQVVLAKIAEEFEPNRDYTEREVSQLLLDFHDDVATLRRGLVEHGLMTRANGIYRRGVE